LTTSAKIIADTCLIRDARITTFEITFPRYLLAELNTHKVLAKSCASSRAIPVKKRIEMVEQNPFVPNIFGLNRPGMQSLEDLEGEAIVAAADEWKASIADAIKHARNLDNLNVHKQQANRILEPYTYVTDVVTGTEWSNFFWLRNSPFADPEFENLASLMHDLYEKNEPRQSSLHLPYCDNISGDTVENLFLISGARCARTSYTTFEGKLSTAEEDIALCKDKLIPSGHLSPFEHAASADGIYFDPHRDGWYWSKPSDHRHLYGWIPYRVQVEKQLGMECKRDSHAKLKEIT
jgi:thymidylate synthase ThyX